MSLPSFETAEAMCALWGHPQAFEDGGCTCGDTAGSVGVSDKEVGNE